MKFTTTMFACLFVLGTIGCGTEDAGDLYSAEEQNYSEESLAKKDEKREERDLRFTSDKKDDSEEVTWVIDCEHICKGCQQPWYLLSCMNCILPNSPGGKCAEKEKPKAAN